MDTTIEEIFQAYISNSSPLSGILTLKPNLSIISSLKEVIAFSSPWTRNISGVLAKLSSHPRSPCLSAWAENFEPRIWPASRNLYLIPPPRWNILS
jgi:hypothetical protein